MQFLTPIDLNRNELQNARIQSLGTAPISPLNGLIYYDTTTNRFMGYAGGWVDLGSVYDGEQLTTTLLNKLNGIATGATKVEDSAMNGNIKINGNESVVYTHPGGTNPHGTSKTDLGLNNVENKSATTILNELTATKISEKLGFMPREIQVGADAEKGNATGSKILYVASDAKKIWLDHAANAWLQVGGQDSIAWGNVTGKPTTFTPPVASGAVLGGIKVGENLTIDANGVLSAAADPAKFIIKEQRYVATAGQTAFTLTNGSYNTGIGSLQVFLNGAKIENNIITETSSTAFALKLGLEAGDILLARYIQLMNVEPFALHASEHLAGGTDPIPLATISANGLMPAADKAKLAGIAAGANAYTHPAYIAKASGLYKVTVDATGHVSAVTPITKSDITSLGIPGQDTVYVVATQSANGLMSATDKVKLDNSSTTTQVNTAIAGAIQAAIANLIDSAPGTMDTLNEIAAALGDDPNFAATITNTLATKVDKVTGMGLSSNDFTAALLTKLNGIAAGANNYVHPAIAALASTFRKVGRDATGHLVDGGAVSKADITALGIPGQDTVYTHPPSHPATMITEDAANRFVSDAEKATWNVRTKKYSATIGNGSLTTIPVTHNLGTQDVAVTIAEVVSPFNVVMADIQIASANTINVLFASAPVAGQYRVTVVG